MPHSLALNPQAMADMVTRREHLAVTSDCKKLRDQSEALQRDKAALAKVCCCCRCMMMHTLSLKLAMLVFAELSPQ